MIVFCKLLHYTVIYLYFYCWKYCYDHYYINIVGVASKNVIVVHLSKVSIVSNVW